MKISSILAIGGANADFCKENNQQECDSASMCSWNGSGCYQASMQASAVSVGLTAALSNVMSGMLMSDQQTASINTSGNSRMASMMSTVGVAPPASASSNSRMGGMFGMMAAQNSMFGMNQFMKCPFNVPYCERTACTMTPLSSSPLERDAFQCYSRPGCCFDETLFVYRQLFGQGFFRGTPLCYRAIDNPIFNQLTQTSYHPTFLSSIVNTVIMANKNAYTNMQARSFIGCPPAADDFTRIQFIQKVAGNNWLIMSQLSDEDGYNDFVEAVSPACGWGGIMEDECFLIGCCWNAGSSTCGSPLSSGLSQERIKSFTTYKMYKNLFEDNDSVSAGKSGVPTVPISPFGSGVTLPLGNSGNAPPFLGRKRRNARDRRQTSTFDNMAMMALLGGGNNGNNNFLGMALAGGGMGGSTSLFGGSPGFGGMGGIGIPGFGGNQGPAEICPSREVASSCMVSSQINAFDFSQKMLLQESCRAKGCCWDEQLYSQMHWGSSINNLYCPWRVQQVTGFPSLDDSVRGCCDTSPCVDRQARNGPGIQPVQPRRPTTTPYTPVQPMWTNWSGWSSCSNSVSERSRSKPGYAPEKQERPCSAPKWSEWRTVSHCSKQCGGGTMSTVRNCTGMGCPQQAEYRDIPCNTHSCSRGGWGGFTPQFGFGK